jgi:tetratricopeptide (TPR) repeat protein
MKNVWSILFTALLTCMSTAAVSQSVGVDNPAALILKADSLIANYQFEKALVVLLKGDSVNTEILLRIGQCNFRLGASTAAIKPFESVLQLDSVNVTALNHLGQLYTRDGDYVKALSCFIKLIHVDSMNAYYYKQAGSVSVRLNELGPGYFWYKQALEINPRDIESAVALANILMVRERYESVDSIVHHALATEPYFKPLLLLSARSAFEQRNYESVTKTVNRLLEKSDTTALTARLLGVSYFHLQDYNKLISCMQFLLKNQYDFEWVYYYMGIAFRELGDASGSANWLKLAVEKSISENTSAYYSQLGQSYEEAGDHQAAIKAYRSAYNYSKDGILLYHLARNYDVYYKDKSMAVTYYQKYLESEDTIRLAREYARQRMQDMGHF